MPTKWLPITQSYAEYTYQIANPYSVILFIHKPEGDELRYDYLGVFAQPITEEEGGISQTPFPAIQRWLERFMRLDGFEPMAGMMPLQMPGEI